MDRSFAAQFGAIALEGALPTLARSRRARADLASALGAADSEAGLRMLEAGELTGNIGASVHDFFTDEIRNQAGVAWSGHMFNPDDSENTEEHYPVHVMEYEGVYFVDAQEYDPVGYFLSLEDAESYIFFNWTDVEAD